MSLIKICMVGEGAFAQKHLDALEKIDDVEVVSIAGGGALATESLASTRGIPHWSLSLDECLSQEGVDAAIFTSPTGYHAAQAMTAMNAGKHVLIEIPMADNLADSEALVALQAKTGQLAMVGHTRRFNPPHQWLHQQLATGQLKLQHLQVQTYFFRRTNTNAKGEPRTWTDSLLWHHACHSVDLFQYQTGEIATDLFALQGPNHPELGIAMDMSIGMKVASGALCSLSLSFNNEGPFGTSFRYICDQGTFLVHYDDLVSGEGESLGFGDFNSEMDGVELCDREFISAIKEGREPKASLRQCLPAMQTLDKLERLLK